MTACTGALDILQPQAFTKVGLRVESTLAKALSRPDPARLLLISLLRAAATCAASVAETYIRAQVCPLQRPRAVGTRCSLAYCVQREEEIINTLIELLINLQE